MHSSSRRTGWNGLFVVCGAFCVHSTALAECIDISYAALRPPVYPQEAIAAKAEGRVLLAVTVGTKGEAESIEIRKSSGNSDLDRAATEAASKWRFNPRTCNGKPEAAIAFVPLEFDLSQYLSSPAGNAIEERPSDAEPSLLSEPARELARDKRLMEFSSVPAMLDYLQHDADVRELGALLAVSSTLTRRDYLRSSERSTFQVWETSEFGWTAASGGWISIIRTRFLERGQKTWELYAQLCNGAPTWCSDMLASYLRTMKEMPPPIPPPAPRDPIGR